MHVLPIPPVISEFARKFTSAGYSLHVVGGAVRDYFLGRPHTDYDFATDAMPEQVMKLFRTVIPTGAKHGTVTVLWKGKKLEVTTYRIESDYADFRHPNAVTFVRSLAEDLRRRDFTINALAADAMTGRVIDLHQGLSDLKHKIIRAIGDPVERFNEDALRIMRACRFASQLEFSIEQHTRDAMAALGSHLIQVSSERLRDELMKILSSNFASIGLWELVECRGMSTILPELERCKDATAGERHRGTLLEHLIETADHVPAEKPLVRLAAVLHDIGKFDAMKKLDGAITFHRHEQIGAAQAEVILNRLKFSNKDRDAVLKLIENHMYNYDESWSDGAVRRFVKRIGMDSLGDLFLLRCADQLSTTGIRDYLQTSVFETRIKRVLERGSALSVRDLAIHGEDLASIGIPRGPAMGETLNMLLETVLDDPSQNNREQLLVIAQRWNRLRNELHSGLNDS